MKRTVVFAICVFSIQLLHAQEDIESVRQDSIYEYTIIHRDFAAILDSFIFNEQQYDYYTPNTYFFINVLDSSGGIIELMSGRPYESHPKIFDYQFNNAGLLRYKDHLFILNGRSEISAMILKPESMKAPVYIESIDLDESEIDKELVEVGFFPTSWIYILKDGRLQNSSKSAFKMK